MVALILAIVGACFLYDSIKASNLTTPISTGYGNVIINGSGEVSNPCGENKNCQSLAGLNELEAKKGLELEILSFILQAVVIFL